MPKKEKLPKQAKHEKQQKKRKGRSVQDFIGVKTFTKYGLMTQKGELLFYLVSPTNISVLSYVNIEIKIRHLMMVLSSIPDIEITCTDSSECFDDNKAYLHERLEYEQNPKVRKLIKKDIEFLDNVQVEMATARQFLFTARIKASKDKQVFDTAEKIEVGKWMALVSEDVEMCAEMFSEYHEPLIVGLITFVVSLIIGTFLSWKMILVVILCSAFSVLIPKLFVGKIEKAQQAKLEEKENINNNVIRPLFHKELISIFRYEDKCSELYKKSYRRFADESITEEKYYSAMTGTNIGVSFTVATIWMIVGAYFLSKGAINIGIFAAFMILNDYFSWPFTEVGKLIAKKRTVYVSEERINAFLHIEKEKSNTLLGENSSHIWLHGVKFKYDDQYCLEVDNLKCQLNPKDWISITGESGSGKTTLAKLMIGVYKPSAGTVEFNYISKKCSNTDVTEYVSFLPKGELLLDATIRENIRIGNPCATDEEIKEVVRLTCLEEMIANLPAGYDTVVGQNSPVRLSGGQLARLNLARVLLKNTPIYILDEFSAEMDIEWDLYRTYAGWIRNHLYR